MNVVLVIAILVAGLVMVVMALPCEACRRRRQRLREAYALWRRQNLSDGSDR